MRVLAARTALMAKTPPRAPAAVTPAAVASAAVALAAMALAAVALSAKCLASQRMPPTQHPAGTSYQAVFTQYSPLFSNAEILRRLLSPLAGKAVRDSLAQSLEAMTPYPVDLTKERFLVYVPTGPPPSPRGFALFVFVPPWDEPRLPFGWAAQLDRYGVIFVTPAAAGNTAAVLSRRVPLALAAEENLVRQYPIDRGRIYVGGFSGGSRVALRIALDYPDIFRGAILNAGADPLGDAHPLPPRDLFLRFQSSSRLVFITGDRDTSSLASDASSSQSMQDWCVFDVETYETPDVGHELMSPAAFGRALDRLLHPTPPDPKRLRACRSRVEAELGEKLDRAQALVSKSSHPPACRLLLEIDKRYGGLAAPRILELAHESRCEPGAGADQPPSF